LEGGSWNAEFNGRSGHVTTASNRRKTEVFEWGRQTRHSPIERYYGAARMRKLEMRKAYGSERAFD